MFIAAKLCCLVRGSHKFEGLVKVYVSWPGYPRLQKKKILPGNQSYKI